MFEFAAVSELYRPPAGEKPNANQALEYERWSGHVRRASARSYPLFEIEGVTSASDPSGGSAIPCQ
jgi:hypothetical protein